jgi:hypothetical protein
MLKKDVTYEDFEGNQVTETLYFHFAKSELVKMRAVYGEDLDDKINKMIESNDNVEIIKIFEDILLGAYGQKSDDGKRFIKNDELREQFRNSLAYDAIFMEMATDDSANAIAEFIKGVMPKDMQEEIGQQVQQKVAAMTLPPPAEVPGPPPIPPQHIPTTPQV